MIRQTIRKRMQAKLKAIRIELRRRMHQPLKEQGKWLHLWRVAGKFANVSIFDVESPAELHEILNSLPLYPFMKVDVTALCHHPGSLELHK